MLAFFFGYFFRYIRGRSGLAKALLLSAIYVGCLLPVWIFTVGSALPITFLLNLVYLPLVGLVAFDYPTFKVAMGGKFDWRSFAQIANIPGLTAFASLALTAIGFVVSSLVTGEYKEIVSAVLKTALPQLTGQAPPH